MKARTSSSGVSIGGLTVLVIFTVLCLTIFSVISLGSAQADQRLSEKNLDQTIRYYEADAKAEEALRKIDRALQLAPSADSSSDGKNIWHLVETMINQQEIPGGRFDRETKQFSFEIPMSDVLSLGVVLQLDYPGIQIAGGDGETAVKLGMGRYTILEWKVYSTLDYTIDEGMNVWGGE